MRIYQTTNAVSRCCRVPVVVVRRSREQDSFCGGCMDSVIAPFAQATDIGVKFEWPVSRRREEWLIEGPVLQPSFLARWLRQVRLTLEGLP